MLKLFAGSRLIRTTAQGEKYQTIVCVRAYEVIVVHPRTWLGSGCDCFGGVKR